MIFQTIGRTIYPNKLVPVKVIETKSDLAIDQNVFCLYLLEEAHGLILNGNKKLPVNGPSLFCANNQEAITFKLDQPVNIRVLGFKPSFINDAFTYETLYVNDQTHSMSYNREKIWLDPFLRREYDNGLMMPNLDLFSRVNALFTNISNELTEQRDNYWPCRTRSYLIELLILLERVHYSENVVLTDTLEEKDLSECILEYLNQNYMNKIAMKDLTEHFGVNRTTLTKSFKDVYDQTPLKYLKEIRLKTAKALLENTALQISEIVHRIGFEDSAHFYRTFKSYSGVSPMHYRQTIINDK